jgi:hypothetical protein
MPNRFSRPWCGRIAQHGPSIALAFIALFASESLLAADFRVLNFAEACERLSERESALGSKPFEGKLPSGYQFAFRHRDFDRDVVIGYACRDGKFYRGAYIFDARDQADASQIYRELKRRTTRNLGAPYYDFASAEHRRKVSEVGATLSIADTQVAFWKNDRYEAHASVAEPSKDRGWRVSLSFTALSALEE